MPAVFVNPGPGADPFADVQRRAEQALRECGPGIAADVRKAVSIPVGRDGAGNVIQRSLPGEAPRREIGIHYRSIGWEVRHENGQTVLVIFSDSDRAVKLEFGDRRQKPRPHLGPALGRWQTYVTARVQRAVGTP